MASFRPNPGFILVKEKAQEQFTASGLLIPESAKNPQIEAEVVACHPEDTRYPVGTTVVLLNKFVGIKAKINGQELLIVNVGEGSEVCGTMVG